ncbi:MAG: hypothetical protein AAFQ94_13070 [Bacteroidota bacterium]
MKKSRNIKKLTSFKLTLSQSAQLKGKGGRAQKMKIIITNEPDPMDSW